MRLEPRERRSLQPCSKHQDRNAAELGDELAQRGAHLGGRAVGVVDHDESARPCRARARKDSQRG
ncbi:MAG TPA: hypothetical protein VFN44_01470, partial [Solirubrobacteraceae bacterium]|nr:hypothetical protein [Solirubrobacteraceae bacterium]